MEKPELNNAKPMKTNIRNLTIIGLVALLLIIVIVFDKLENTLLWSIGIITAGYSVFEILKDPAKRRGWVGLSLSLIAFLGAILNRA